MSINGRIQFEVQGRRDENISSSWAFSLIFLSHHRREVSSTWKQVLQNVVGKILSRYEWHRIFSGKVVTSKIPEKIVNFEDRTFTQTK
jgi:hypothetical protein